VVYVTANLKAPAVLHVIFSDGSRSIHLPAGSTDVQVPIAVGPAPRFELLRGTARLTAGGGDDPISAVGIPPNYYYSTGAMHD
jgi:hypothetical protein